MANAYYRQFFYTHHVKPVLEDCSFVVDNTSGTGINSLKGQGIDAVFMHTNITPTGGNPNPANGYIIVRLKSNHNLQYNGFDRFISPLTGATINISTAASLTLGVPYVITALGTTTQAQWQAIGLPSGITAAVGVSFVATAIVGAGTGTVRAVGISGATKIEQLVNPNVAFSNGKPGQMSYLYFQILAATSSSVTTAIPTAPANGTTIQMSFYLSDSSVTVLGE